MRDIDGKYQTTGDIQKKDGTPIPMDEPLFLFRGKDKLLPRVLEQYKELSRNAGSPQQQLDLLDQRIAEVKKWQTENPDKVKIPD
ncbi:MAG: hypothetical protein Q8P54_02000 [bacterium]|nr:hypothetical protein [bacterium]